MADNTLTESAPKCLNGLEVKCKDPPEKYLYKDAVGDTSCLQLMEIAVVDMGLLLASPSRSTQELEKLCFAATSCGFFMLINHGMTSSFLDKVRGVTKQFFELPVEEKQKCAKQVNSREGYGSDNFLQENQVLDWNERLGLVLSPEDQRRLRYWPRNPSDFRETIFEYTTKLELIHEVLLKAMAVSLNLEEHCFLDKYGARQVMRSRFNLYPACSKCDRVLGLKPHSDLSTITMLLQDKEVEGLQVMKDDQWFRVPVIPDALVINIGDQMEIVSNGLFKSATHRVVINPERERISLAVFCLPEPDREIEPVDGLVNEMTPRRYRKVKNYDASFLQNYQRRKRLIDDLKI